MCTSFRHILVIGLLHCTVAGGFSQSGPCFSVVGGRRGSDIHTNHTSNGME